MADMIHYSPETDIVLEKILDEYVLVRLPSGDRKNARTVQINATGAKIWELLEEGKDLSGIAEVLSDLYEGTETDILKNDITAFLDALYASGYLKIMNSGNSSEVNIVEL